MWNLKQTAILTCIAALVAPSMAAAFTTAPVFTLPGIDPQTGKLDLPSDARIVPLRGDPPAGITPELVAKATAAAASGMGVDVATGEPVAIATNWLFIRPGAWMVFPNYCTMNFIYGTPGSYQIGTAGHCVAYDGQPVAIVAKPDTDPDLLVILVIGTVNDFDATGIGSDWALIDIDSVWQGNVDTDTAEIMGPEDGVYTGSPSMVSPLPVKHFGHGLGIGTGGTPRVGVSPVMTSPCTFYFWGAASIGDSGSPVLVLSPTEPLGGKAVGILTDLVVFGTGFTLVAGTRVKNTCVPADVVDGNGDFLS